MQMNGSDSQKALPAPITIGRATLYNCDCLDFMATVADGFYSLAIVDPPYGIEKEISVGGGSHTKNKTHFHQLYSEGHKQWDIRPSMFYFSELQRVSRNQIVCGGNYFANMLPASRGWVVWDKVTDGFTSVHPELIYTSFHKACGIFRRCQGLNNGFLNKEGGNIHPTQKPIELYTWLLFQYANLGDTIIDTHMGSGSSVIAAINAGFDITACEVDSEYFNAARRRIERSQLQGRLEL